MSTLSFQEAGGWCWHGGTASGKLFWETALCLYSFPSPRSVAFIVLRGTLVVQGRGDGLWVPIQLGSWETHGFPAGNGCVSYHPASSAIYSKSSRNLSGYLWDPGVYFDSVAVFGFVLVIFLFLEAEWISPGLCNCCTTFWLCVVQGSAVVSGDVPLKYSYYLSSLYKLHQISTRHFQKLLLIGQPRLQS